MSEPVNYRWLNQFTIAVRVGELRSDTEYGRTMGLMKISRAIRVQYQSFVFKGVQEYDDSQWFIFECVGKR